MQDWTCGRVSACGVLVPMTDVFRAVLIAVLLTFLCIQILNGKMVPGCHAGVAIICSGYICSKPTNLHHRSYSISFITTTCRAITFLATTAHKLTFIIKPCTSKYWVAFTPKLAICCINAYHFNFLYCLNCSCLVG